MSDDAGGQQNIKTKVHKPKVKAPKKDMRGSGAEFGIKLFLENYDEWEEAL